MLSTFPPAQVLLDLESPFSFPYPGSNTDWQKTAEPTPQLQRTTKDFLLIFFRDFFLKRFQPNDNTAHVSTCFIKALTNYTIVRSLRVNKSNSAILTGLELTIPCPQSQCITT